MGSIQRADPKMAHLVDHLSLAWPCPSCVWGPNKDLDQGERFERSQLLAMRVLSAQEAAAWCQAHHVALSRGGRPERSDPDLKFEIPRDAQKRVYLVNQAMEAFSNEPLFLVWFDNWSVWPLRSAHARLRSASHVVRRNTTIN